MTSSRRALASIIFALSVTTIALPARAQSRPPTAQELETARALYKEGKDLRAAGDLRGALEKLQAAHALGQTPVTGIELARTYVLVGRLVEAREVALSIARLGVASDETGKSAEARTEGAKLAEDLRPRIPALSVKVRGLAPGDVGQAHLVIDGVVVPDAALVEAQKVNPGKHVLVLYVGDGASARQARADAEVAEGQVVEVTIDAPPPGAAPAPLVSDLQVREQPHGMPLLVKLGFGVAIAGVAVGLYAGVSALDKKNEVAAECTNDQCGRNNSGASDLDSARTWANVSTVSFIVAGAGLAAGIVALVLDHRQAPPSSAMHVSPLVGLGFAGVHGDF